MKNKKVWLVILLSLMACFVDGIISPPYFYKSVIKVTLFFFVPLIYLFKSKEDIKPIFRPNSKGIKLAFVIGVGIYIVVLGAYFAFRNFIDLSVIKESLTGGIGVNKENFVYVATYISFVNSFVEEFFFRGFAYLILRKYTKGKVAYLLSAFMFAIYHVGITNGWFNIFIYLLATFGMFVGGCIFNSLDKENIYPSWIVHMFAIFAINTVGFILFGII